MTTFEWKPDYSVGHAEIDAQHQRLLAILNDLSSQLHGTDPPADRDAQAIFDRLAGYVTDHFAFEEQLMADSGYPHERLAAHVREHDFMLGKVQQFEQLFEDGDAGSLTQVMLFLYGDWLIHHICGTDRDYAPWLASGGVEAAAG